ncbi:MAG: VOC family protein [Gammaproteobacteria bacterium]|nr:VOC family protein [Gammaproteobacteria bacterium]
MTETYLDHIVIGAKSLEAGQAFIKERLGVEIPLGGEHTKMGTHNLLMQLGNHTFLEVISISDTLTPPDRPRWYGLDDPHVQFSLEREPMLLTWVVNSNNLQKLIQQASYSLGASEPISRGDLNWFFGLPEDGRLLAGGLLPYAMQWCTDQHPSQRMANLKCSLKSLTIAHPYPDWIHQALTSIDAQHLVELKKLTDNQAPYFSVEISTPSGFKTLHSCTGPSQC